MTKKKSELTIENVAKILIVLGVIVVCLYLIFRNKIVMEKLLYLFRGLI